MYDRTNPSLFDCLEEEDTLPVDSRVRRYWVHNLRSPMRRGPLSLIRIVRTLMLYGFYFLRRITPNALQLSFPRLLQRVINFHLKWFVIPEAGYLIVRHFWTESNVINFIVANSRRRDLPPLDLYPLSIGDLMKHTFVDHDVALFNALHDLGPVDGEEWPVAPERWDFSSLREVSLDPVSFPRRWTQFIDFEAAHELFKATFCILLNWDEYERSTTSLQFDHVLALRVARILGNPGIASWAGNRFPHLLLGPTGIGQRFILHGLFVEHVHEHLLRLKRMSNDARRRALTLA